MLEVLRSGFEPHATIGDGCLCLSVSGRLDQREISASRRDRRFGVVGGQRFLRARGRLRPLGHRRHRGVTWQPSCMSCGRGPFLSTHTKVLAKNGGAACIDSTAGMVVPYQFPTAELNGLRSPITRTTPSNEAATRAHFEGLVEDLLERRRSVEAALLAIQRRAAALDQEVLALQNQGVAIYLD